MKKAILLNAPVSRVVSLLGHGDSLCVADAGLLIPYGVERIDLAVRAGLPPFLDTFSALTTEMYVDRAVIAAELQENQPELYAQLLEAIQLVFRNQGNEIEAVAHDSLKTLTQACKAVVRTGECTPYSNIILYAGVTF